MSKDALEQLKTQLDNTGDDPKHSESFAQLKATLERGADDPDDMPTLLEELERSIILFGDDHPDLTKAIRSAINTLSLGGL
ncbi:MAG: DUF4404 family protein [Anaerolineae bacterium]|nr:DUF4404 family protein [Anaerolineae bacterium]